MTIDPNAPEYRKFPLHAGAVAFTRASADAVWDVVSAIGGANRYYTLNGLWAAREWIDAMVGGPGRLRVRPEGRGLKPGDLIDSWSVLIADNPTLLALSFGMKAPGRGVLEFRADPQAGGTKVTATAFWVPNGLAGELYWAAMKPAHLVLFKRLTAEVCHRAERSPHPARSVQTDGTTA